MNCTHSHIKLSQAINILKASFTLCLFFLHLVSRASTHSVVCNAAVTKLVASRRKHAPQDQQEHCNTRASEVTSQLNVVVIKTY